MKKPECMLCEMGYHKPAVETPVYPALRIGKKMVNLCEYHHKFMMDWAQPEEQRQMLDLLQARVAREAG